MEDSAAARSEVVWKRIAQQELSSLQHRNTCLQVSKLHPLSTKCRINTIHCLAVSLGADSKLASYAQEDVDAKLIFQLAAEGDQMCNRLIAEVNH